MYGRARKSATASSQSATSAAAIVPSMKLSPASNRPATWSGVIGLLLLLVSYRHGRGRGRGDRRRRRPARPGPSPGPRPSITSTVGQHRPHRSGSSGRPRAAPAADAEPGLGRLERGGIEHRQRGRARGRTARGRAQARLGRRSGSERRRGSSASPSRAPARYSWIAPAARRPAATASMIVLGPVTTSPPAKTPGRPVARVRGSAAIPAQALVSMPGALGQDRRVGLLADGHQDGVGRHDRVRAGDRGPDGRPPSDGAGRRLLGHPEPATRPSTTEDLGDGHADPDLDALAPGGFDLLDLGGHLLEPAPVEDRHGVGAAAQGGARGIHGGAAATDDDDAADEPRGLAEVDLLEEDGGGDRLREGRPRGRRGDGSCGAPVARKIGLEALRLEVVEGEVATHDRVEAKLHAQPDDPVDLGPRGPRAAGGTPGSRWPSCRRGRASPRRPSRRSRAGRGSTPPTCRPARRRRSRPARSAGPSAGRPAAGVPCSTAKRLSVRIAIGSSSTPRRQADSHGAVQIQPHTDGNGLTSAATA